MKFYTEMSDEELLALTTEQMEDCAKLCLVKEGLPLPYPKPEVKTVDSFTAHSIDEIYEVCGCLFQNLQDAERMRDAAKSSITTDYEWMPGSIPNIQVKKEEGYKPAPLAEIKPIKVYSPETAKTMKKYSSDKEKLELPIKNWQKVMEKYDEFYSDVRSAVWRAQDRLNEKNERDSYMQECLRLADNDQVIAQRFFEKRFPSVSNDNET